MCNRLAEAGCLCCHCQTVLHVHVQYLSVHIATDHVQYVRKLILCSTPNMLPFSQSQSELMFLFMILSTFSHGPLKMQTSFLLIQVCKIKRTS